MLMQDLRPGRDSSRARHTRLEAVGMHLAPRRPKPRKKRFQGPGCAVNTATGPGDGEVMRKRNRVCGVLGNKSERGQSWFSERSLLLVTFQRQNHSLVFLSPPPAQAPTLYIFLRIHLPKYSASLQGDRGFPGGSVGKNLDSRPSSQ